MSANRIILSQSHDDGNGYIDDIHGWDFCNNDNSPMDDNGHGTHCAGTIAGVGDNEIGVAGVNWHAQLVALKFLDSSGNGYASDAIEAIEYTILMDIPITSNSWGSYSYSQSLYDAIALAKDADQLFVAAAGNNGLNTDVNPHYPASYNLSNIISVAATDCNDELASLPTWASNYGVQTVDLAAPGVDIYSTWLNNGYNTISGTSMATPHVAGAAALCLAQTPWMSWQGIKNAILANIDQLNNLEGIILTEGRLNTYSSLRPPWLSLYPHGGTVGIGNETNITVTFNATNIDIGVYDVSIFIWSNDPDENPVIVPVHLNVTPADHDIAVTNMNVGSTANLYEETIVNATIENKGLNNETNVVVQLLVNGSQVNYTTIAELDISGSVNVSLSWIPNATGEFNVSMYAVPVPGENVTFDNVISTNVTVIDNVSPQWRDQGQSVTEIPVGGNISLYAQGKDETALDWVWLATNETGVWHNFSGSGWWYYKQIDISNPSANYQIPITVYREDGYDDVSNGIIDCEGHCNVNFSDICFSASDKTTKLPYWIEEIGTTGSDHYAHIWVKTSGDAAIYMYYGNTSAKSASNGTDTFAYFDHWVGDNTGDWIHREPSTNCHTWWEDTTSFSFYRALESKSMLKSWNAGPWDITQLGWTETKINDPNSVDYVAVEWNMKTSYGATDSTVLIQLRVGKDSTVTTTAIKSVTKPDPNHILSLRIVYSSNNVSYEWKDLDTGIILASDSITNSSQIPSPNNVKYFYHYQVDYPGGIHSWLSPTFLKWGNQPQNGGMEMHTDYWFIRNYTSSEPSWITFGSEQKCSSGYGSPMKMQEGDQWQWSNFTWQNSSIPFGTTVGWRIYYGDTSGNVNCTDIMNFTIIADTIPPVISNIDALPSIQEAGKCVNISCDVTDNAMVNAVMINITGPISFIPVNVSMVSIPGTNIYYYNSTYTILGIYSYFIWANDASGNANTSAVLSFEIINAPPIANFTYSPSSPTTADTIIFTDNSSDVDGSIVNWTWNFDDGNTSTEQNPTHQYADDGDYNVCLTVMDDDGANDTICKTITVENVGPIANFTWTPQNPTTQDLIQFTDTSTDPGKGLVNWTWNFDDGNTSTEQNPTHQYSNPSMYTVCLTVKDDDNATDTTCKIINVTSAVEIIDVNQSTFDRGFPIRHAIDGDWGAAQNFTPTLDTLTSVDIYLRKFGTPEFNLTIELREDGPEGTLFDTVVFTPDEVASSWQWLNIDFDDVNVGVGSDIFIVLPPAPSGVTTSFGYEWGYAFGNQYDGGSFWFTRDGGNWWRALPTMYEFVFRTYGHN